jgi:hypothetical protein
VQLQLCTVRVDELAKRGLVARASAAEGSLGHDTTSDRIAKRPVRIRRRRGRNEHDDETGLMRRKMTEPIAAPAAVRAAVPVTAATLTTLAVAAAAWVVLLRQMNGMDMGVETELASFASFVGFWAAMMAAMMLPGAAVGVFGRRVRGVPQFVGAYLGVWTLVGVVAYAFYRPHGSLVAGALTVAAGLYELTSLKRACRRRCRERVQSGLAFGVSCVGSSIALMLVPLALGVMSVTWMSLIAAVVFVQKLVPEQRGIDVPLALAIVGLGILIVDSPALVPGLNPRM